MRIDVAICTWNRSRLLAPTLERLRELEVPQHVDWQVIVVDNNCTDDTAATLQRFAGRLPLRTTFEPRPGHSNARNRAVAEATGDLVPERWAGLASAWDELGCRFFAAGGRSLQVAPPKPR